MHFTVEFYYNEKISSVNVVSSMASKFYYLLSTSQAAFTFTDHGEVAFTLLLVNYNSETGEFC